MGRASSRTALWLLILLLSGSIAVVGSGQATQPEWEDALFNDMKDAAGEYNSQADSGKVWAHERWLIQDAKINLYVRSDTSTAVYSFRIDEQMRITDLRQTKYDNPTYQVITSKETADEIIAADNTHAAIRGNIRTRQIRVQRVLHLLGIAVAIGIKEGVVGLGGIALSTFALTKINLLRILRRAIQSIWNALQWLWQSLGRIATLLSILEIFGALQPLKQKITRLYKKIIKKATELKNGLFNSFSNTKKSDD